MHEEDEFEVRSNEFFNDPLLKSQRTRVKGIKDKISKNA
jgi:hypothetical protein